MNSSPKSRHSTTLTNEWLWHLGLGLWCSMLVHGGGWLDSDGFDTSQATAINGVGGLVCFSGWMGSNFCVEHSWSKPFLLYCWRESTGCGRYCIHAMYEGTVNGDQICIWLGMCWNVFRWERFDWKALETHGVRNLSSALQANFQTSSIFMTPLFSLLIFDDIWTLFMFVLDSIPCACLSFCAISSH